jgi:RNA polymerase sigma-70 factor (TIGR02960 family)
VVARVAPPDDSFRKLTAPYLAELHLHCYRMLGSLTDADDVLQEVLVAAWRGLGGFEGRASLRTWLYRIATNRCLNELRSRSRRPLDPVPPFDPPEPTRRGDVPWLQPYPDADLEPAVRYQTKETVELAFVEALQRLPRRQVAVLLLCDVLGFPPAEVAGMLDATPTAVKGLLQRARSGVDRPGGNADQAVDEPEEELARRFADAYVRDDVDAVVAMLTDDAWLAMPPAPHEYQGRSAIASFLEASGRARSGRRFVLVPTGANGHPAFGVYLPDADGAPLPVGIAALSTYAGRIVRITRFLDAGLPGRFGLQSPR